VHNEELHNLYASPSIIRMIKSRRMYHEWGNAYRILVGKARRKETTGKTETYVGGQY
jgi:hypothetical protein